MVNTETFTINGSDNTTRLLINSNSGKINEREDPETVAAALALAELGVNTAAANAIRSLADSWVHGMGNHTYLLETIPGSDTTLKGRWFKVPLANFPPSQADDGSHKTIPSHIVPGSAAWKAWWTNPAHASEIITNVLTYEGMNADPAGIILSSPMSPISTSVAAAYGHTATATGKIVFNPDLGKAYNYDMTWPRKFTKDGWASQLGMYAWAKAKLYNSELELLSENPGTIAWLAWAEQVIEKDGLTGFRYEVEGVMQWVGFLLVSGFALSKGHGADYFKQNLVTPIIARINEKVSLPNLDTILNLRLAHVGLYLRTMEDKAISSIGDTLWNKIAPNGYTIITKPGSESHNILSNVSKGTDKVAMTQLVYETIKGFEKQKPYQNFTEMPFGLTASQMSKWLDEVGTKLLNDFVQLSEGLNIVCFPAVIMEPSTGGWSNKEINTMGDWVGLNCRANNRMADVLTAAGANCSNLSPPQIAAAVTAGTLDYAEFNSVSVDKSFELFKFYFDEFFKYKYTPSWAERTNVYFWIFNKDLWDGLSDEIQTEFHTKNKQGLIDNTAMQIADGILAEQHFADKGVTTLTYPVAVLDGLEDIWKNTVLPGYMTNSDFATLYKSQTAYRV